jgi:hypothetical protein
VNEVLVSAADVVTGWPATVTMGYVWVQLLKPTNLTFITQAVEADSYTGFWRVKLAVFEGTEVPKGLNLAAVTVTDGGNYGVALCSVSLTDDIPKSPLPEGDVSALAQMRMPPQPGGEAPAQPIPVTLPKKPGPPKKR